jgi:hypothetical protein
VNHGLGVKACCTRAEQGNEASAKARAASRCRDDKDAMKADPLELLRDAPQ